MSSEGQLKKRIREDAKDDYYFQVSEVDLIKWLDEAKKDLQKRLKEVGDVSPEEGLDVYYAWVTDWFGDST